MRAAYLVSDALLLRRVSHGRSRAFEHYLDVNKMFEEFGLAKEITALAIYVQRW
jgi:hypothetical protein